MVSEIISSTYYLNRLRNLVFGAWLNWTQEQISLEEEEAYQIDSQRRTNQLLHAINSLDVFTKSQFQKNKQKRRADWFYYFFIIKTGINNLRRNVVNCNKYCSQLESDYKNNQAVYLDEMRLMSIRHCFNKMKRRTLRRLKRSRKQHMTCKPIIIVAFSAMRHFSLKSHQNNAVYQYIVKYSEKKRLKRRLCTYKFSHNYLYRIK
jgi:hypothetical protein